MDGWMDGWMVKNCIIQIVVSGKVNEHAMLLLSTIAVEDASGSITPQQTKPQQTIPHKTIPHHTVSSEVVSSLTYLFAAGATPRALSA